jgi:hypothetical protein
MTVTAAARPIALGTVTVAAAAVLRARQRRWGATDDEVNRTLPGDDLISPVDLTATRAITIHATAAQVWPWIAQLGQGRGGFYSYDFLENLVGCDIHSADRIVPEWQRIDIGAQVKLAPQVALAVALVVPARALVLRGGIPMGNTPPPYQFTWAFVLREAANRTSRLVVRERYRYTRRWAPLLVEPVQFVSLLMTQRMLRGIKQRAERTTRTAPPSESPCGNA